MQKDIDIAGLDSFRRICHENSLKITPQRTAIYEHILNAENHPTAKKLYSEVAKRYPNISLDTVNRTLLTFAEIGLVCIVEGFGSARRYDSRIATHHHMHCIKCGKIIDIYDKSFDKLEVPPKLRKKYKIINKRVVLNGLCESCER